MNRTLALLATSLLLTAPAVAAPKAWEKCIRKYCTSTTQSTCTVKGGAAICDRDQIQCKELPDFAAAKVRQHAGKRYEVETVYGRGWVSERMMMLSNVEDSCSS